MTVEIIVIACVLILAVGATLIRLAIRSGRVTAEKTQAQEVAKDAQDQLSAYKRVRGRFARIADKRLRDEE